MLKNIYKAIDDFAAFLPSVAASESDLFYTQFHQQIEMINASSSLLPDFRPELMKYCFEMCSCELDKSTLMKRVRHKPLGYPGDFLTIDWIYTEKTDSPDGGAIWDSLFHRLTAAEAVRNRKDFFINLFSSFCENMRDKPAVLDLACGPCRDLLEAITEAGAIAEGSHFHCIDSEGMAINYAKALLMHIDQKGVSLTFSNANVFRLKKPHRYDLVWTAGLFDYLDDRLAVVLLRKMWGWTKNGGSLVVGNFHPRNSSRNLMEWCANWALIHRTEEDFFRLCNEAGIPDKHINFEQEPLGVCIFLVVQKKD